MITHQTKRALRRPLVIVMALVLTAFLFLFFCKDPKNSQVLFCLAAAGLACILDQALNIRDKAVMCVSALCSGVLALTFVLGRMINLWSEPYFNHLRVIDGFYLAALWGTMYAIFLVTLRFFRDASSIAALGSRRRIWLVASACMFFCWMPYFLLHYPGNLTPDSLSSVRQALGQQELSNHHPIAFTLLIKACMGLGSLFSADICDQIACFTVLQMLLLAAVLGCCVSWFSRIDAGRNTSVIVVLIMMFFSLNPVIASYAITMWKDVLFGGWILLLVLFLYDVAQSHGILLCTGKGMIGFAACCLLVAFGRNNGVYIVWIVAAVVLLCYVRFWKRLLPLCLSIVIGISLIQGPGYRAMGIKPSNFAESVGIMLQQIAYSIRQNGDVSEEDRAFLEQVIPAETMCEAYVPTSPDRIKFHEQFDHTFLNAHKGEFIRVWLHAMPQNFSSYVKAWLISTLGYYHIGTTNWVTSMYINQNDMGIHQTDWIARWTGVSLRDWFDETLDKFLYLPPENLIYSIACMVWFTVFYCAVMVLKKRFDMLLPVVPLIVLWGTLMVAAPAFCEFRYMFSFHLALPFLVLMLWVSPAEKTIR